MGLYPSIDRPDNRIGSKLNMRTLLTNKSWGNLLNAQFQMEYFECIETEIDAMIDVGGQILCPKRENIFRALNLCGPEDIRVVIVGQDPYYKPGLADGLAFSTGENMPSPSLQNILKEIGSTVSHGELSNWAAQGVLLLNSSLTTVEGIAGAHKHIGWHRFTDSVIERVNSFVSPIVFMLWGNDAKEKQKLLHNPNHLVLTAPHPSPLSAGKGFTGCNHFNIANDFLIKGHRQPINWSIHKDNINATLLKKVAD